MSAPELVARACVFPECGTLFASDTIAAGVYLCEPHRGTGTLPLTELERIECGLAAAPVDLSTHFKCGHERTPENIYPERTGRRDAAGDFRLNDDGERETRDRCLTCKRAKDNAR